jgi:hypothetical protein
MEFNGSGISIDLIGGTNLAKIHPTNSTTHIAVITKRLFTFRLPNNGAIIIKGQNEKTNPKIYPSVSSSDIGFLC